MHTGGVGAENLLHHAVLLDKIAPVFGGEKTKACDAIADRNLVGGLGLSLGPDQFLDCQSLCRHPVFEPAVGERKMGAFAPQMAGDLREEGAGHVRGRPCHVRHHQNQIGWIQLDHARHAIGPSGGNRLIPIAGRHPFPDPAQVFNQRQAQHDRHRPQLPEVQRRDTLIRRHEAVEAGRVRLAVGVRNHLQDKTEHTREPHERAPGDAGEILTVCGGQVDPGRVDLLFDQVEIIEQPFRPRRQGAIVPCRLSQQTVRGKQRLLVIVQSRDQLLSGPTRYQLMC